MMTSKNNSTNSLDQILAIQIAIAWAGEKDRLSWWNSEVTNEFGGFTQLLDLTPSSASWLSLKTVREIAKRMDKKARRTANDADNIYTIFRLGFEIDEQLDQRLTDLIHSDSSQKTLLKHVGWLSEPNEQDWDAEDFTNWLRGLVGDRGQHKDEPLGRRIVGEASEDLVERISKLANHLWPLTDTYTIPHYKGMK
jgi:hypothetical protein